MKAIVYRFMALALTVLGALVFPERCHCQLVPGTTAPLFTLTGLDYNRYNLNGAKDSPLTILYFFDIGSQPSENDLATLNTLARKHKLDKSVWAITTAPREKVAQFASRHKGAYSILPDDGKVTDLYQARQALPVVYLIRSGLTITDCVQGLSQITEARLAGLPDPPPRLDDPARAPEPPAQVSPSVYNDPTTNMAFARVKGGCFEMKSPSGEKTSGPKVCVDDFTMGMYEVTVGQYLKFTRATKGNYPQWMEEGSKYNVQSGTDNHYRKIGNALTADRNPIVGVSWHNAVAFADWLSSQSGGRKKYRLPKEAEWEFACRNGGYDLTFCGSDNVDSIAWNSRNSGGATHGVGQKRANDLGLFDMSGNVWEWTDLDRASTSDQNQDASDPREDIQGVPSRVIRGGGWTSNPASASSYSRDALAPGVRSNDLGFRLVVQDPD